jgi:hypothetical protein
LQQKSCASKDCHSVKQQNVGGAVEPSPRSRVRTGRRESDTGCAEQAGDYEERR